MKSKTFNKKLSLKKETIANLKSKEMGNVNGGYVTFIQCSNPKPCAATRDETACGSNPCC